MSRFSKTTKCIHNPPLSGRVPFWGIYTIQTAKKEACILQKPHYPFNRHKKRESLEMPVLSAFLWMWMQVFSCTHAHTRLNEGKCYCPDCGCGLIIRWVVLRCGECEIRRESRYWLRQIIPAQRCCVACGTERYNTETLDSPSYFQLHTARLLMEEVPSDTNSHLQNVIWFLERLFGFSLRTLLEHTQAKTLAWLDPTTTPNKPLALLPLYAHS
jgi:hypothetical protein